MAAEITIYLNSGSTITIETLSADANQLLTDYEQFLKSHNQNVRPYKISTPDGLILVNFTAIEAISAET